MDEIQRAQDDLFYATFPQARRAPDRQARVEAAHAAIYAPLESAAIYAPECIEALSIDALPSQSAPLNYSGVYAYPEPDSWAFYGQQQQPTRLVMPPQQQAASPEPVSAVSSSAASSYYTNDYPEELTPPSSASYSDTAFGADAYAYPYPHSQPPLDGQFSHVLIPPAPDPLAHYTLPPSALDMSLPRGRPLPPYPPLPTRPGHGEQRTRTERPPKREKRRNYYSASPLSSDRWVSYFEAWNVR
jgi:hypothetical protein